jgi:hypothetical protein
MRRRSMISHPLWTSFICFRFHKFAFSISFFCFRVRSVAVDSLSLLSISFVWFLQNKRLRQAEEVKTSGDNHDTRHDYNKSNKIPSGGEPSLSKISSLSKLSLLARQKRMIDLQGSKQQLINTINNDKQR